MRAAASGAARLLVAALLLTAVHPAAAVAQSASTPCPPSANQTELTACADRDAVAADAALNAAYKATLARIAPATRAPLTDAELLWIATRDKTCAFEAGLTAGGTISPMEHADCLARMATHQTRQLLTLPPAPVASAPVDPSADAELNRVYKALVARLTAPADHAALTAAETAWIAFRDKMCALAGDGCLTRLTVERTEELKAGWLGEPFW